MSSEKAASESLEATTAVWHCVVSEVAANSHLQSKQCPLAQVRLHAEWMSGTKQPPCEMQQCLIDKKAAPTKGIWKGDNISKGDSTYVGHALTVTMHFG